MSLAKNIQYLRKQHNLTQEDLSEFLCVSRQSISKWETGEAFPDTEKIIALCDKFNVSMDSLVRGDLTNADIKGINEELFSQDEVEHIKNDSKNNSVEESVMKESLVQEEKASSNCEDKVNKENTPEDSKKEKDYKLEKINQTICGLVMCFAIAIFFIASFATDKWHPTWIIVVCGAFLCAICGIVCDLLKTNRDIKKIMGSCCGIIMCLTALVYVIVNTFVDYWHPTWVMFVFAGLLCGVLGILGDFFDKKTK